MAEDATPSVAAAAAVVVAVSEKMAVMIGAGTAQTESLLLDLLNERLSALLLRKTYCTLLILFGH